MLELQKRNEKLLQIGFENLKGDIKVNKSFKNGIPITNISINLKNIFLEDIDFVISELAKHKEFLGFEFNNSLKHLKT